MRVRIPGGDHAVCFMSARTTTRIDWSDLGPCPNQAVADGALNWTLFFAVLVLGAAILVRGRIRQAHVSLQTSTPP